MEDRRRPAVTQDPWMLFSDYPWSQISQLWTSDAISLALLLHACEGRRSRLHEYYVRLWNALTMALRLPRPAAAFEVLRGGWSGPHLTACGLERFEGIAMTTLLNSRRAIKAFACMNSGFLEGDPWCTFGNEARDAWIPMLENAQQNWQSARDQAVAALPDIDFAICTMLGWDYEATVGAVGLVDRYRMVPPTRAEEEILFEP